MNLSDYVISDSRPKFKLIVTPLKEMIIIINPTTEEHGGFD